LSFPLGDIDGLSKNFMGSAAASWVQLSLEGYQWVSNTSQTLVLDWSVDQSPYNTNQEISVKEGRTVNFNDAFFSINRTTVGSNANSVSLQSASMIDNNPPHDVYVVYDRFGSNLQHVSQFGFGTGPGSYPLVQVNSGNFSVNVVTDDTTGHVRFEYYENSNSTSIYSVGLLQFWEAENGNPNNVVSNPSMLGWTATQGPMTDDDQYWMVMATRGLPDGTSLILNTSIPIGAVKNEKSFSAGQINVQLMGYDWSSDSSQLVFSWVVNHTIRSDMVPTYFPMATGGSGMPDVMIKNVSSKTTVDFDDAYFSAETTAKQSNGSTVGVSLMLNNYSNPSSLGMNMFTPYSQFVYIVYNHFDNGDITHDPEFGIGSGPKSSLLLWIVIIVIVVVIIVILVIAAAVFFVWRSRSHSRSGHPDIFQS